MNGSRLPPPARGTSRQGRLWSDAGPPSLQPPEAALRSPLSTEAGLWGRTWPGAADTHAPRPQEPASVDSNAPDRRPVAVFAALAGIVAAGVVAAELVIGLAAGSL